MSSHGKHDVAWLPLWPAGPCLRFRCPTSGERALNAWEELVGPLAEGACPACLLPLNPEPEIFRLPAGATITIGDDPRAAGVTTTDTILLGPPSCACCGLTWRVEGDRIETEHPIQSWTMSWTRPNLTPRSEGHQ